MKRVKVYSESTAEKLQKKINELLEKDGVELIDIKFRTVMVAKTEPMDHGQKEWYSALVIYK